MVKTCVSSLEVISSKLEWGRARVESVHVEWLILACCDEWKKILQ
jgi:hypothetical protein